MDGDNSIKQAFQKVKEDILSLGHEISTIKLDILDFQKDLALIKQELDKFLIGKLQKESEMPQSNTPTLQHIIPTNSPKTPTHPETPTDDRALYSLNSQDIPISIGNRGVPTDRQTNQQTDRHIFQHIPQEENVVDNVQIGTTTAKENSLENASEILESLDNLKKDLRIKIKRLTPQEMKIFSIIYQLGVEKNLIDYKLLSEKTGLSQSSIRDYTLKITAKGLPIEKKKLNNKQIILNIPQELIKIASLETILKLREL